MTGWFLSLPAVTQAGVVATGTGAAHALGAVPVLFLTRVPRRFMDSLMGHLLRFAGDNYQRDRWLVEALRRVAVDKGCTATQLVEALGALDVRLAPDEMTRIESAVPASAVAGTRYDARQMGILDSERPS